MKLLLARHEGDLLAGNIVAFWKTRAAYLYGASSGMKRNLMPTYALQWEAIRMAREAGCTSYDLYGVPPQPDPGHPMFGLYQFKTGFSDRVLQRWGTWDAPFRPLLYASYRAAEAARMFYYRFGQETPARQAAGERRLSPGPALHIFFTFHAYIFRKETHHVETDARSDRGRHVLPALRARREKLRRQPCRCRCRGGQPGKKLATVSFDPGLTNLKAITAAIEDQGYSVK